MGGPVYGRLGDVVGERIPLVLAFSSAFLSYFLMGIADNLTLLFLSRLPSVFMHVMQGNGSHGAPPALNGLAESLVKDEKAASFAFIK